MTVHGYCVRAGPRNVVVMERTALHPTTPRGHFVRHFLEMVVAMLAGMVVLEPVWPLALDPLGWVGILDLPEPAALVMATNMTVMMSAWMGLRGHGRRAMLEMAAAMYLPFAVLFVPMWMGVLSAGGMLVGGHLLMLPAMVGAMLLRRDEYAGGHQHAVARR